jgi:hypothetical protein
VFAVTGRGYGSSMNAAAIVTGALMVVFAAAMVVAIMLERRRADEEVRDPSRVPPDLRRRAQRGELRRRDLEEKRWPFRS